MCICLCVGFIVCLPEDSLQMDIYLLTICPHTKNYYFGQNVVGFSHTKTYMSIFLKKEKTSQGSKQDASQPESHTASAVTHMSNTSSYSEIPQI